MPIPYNILLGKATPSGNIRDLVHAESIRIEEAGTFESVMASLAIRDKALAYTAMRGEWHLAIIDRPTGQLMFRGLVRTPSREMVVREHGLQIEADDIGVLLDRCILTTHEEWKITRPAGESMKARISWLFGSMTHANGSVWGSARVAQPLLAAGLNYTTSVAALSTDMPRQRFPPNLTLRQALERILGAASDSANYYLAWPFLHVFDDSHPESSRTAPFDIDATHAPGAGEVAPEEMVADWDTSRLINGYMVRGKNRVGSGFLTDQDVLGGPWSVNLFGLRTAYLDAPDSDTQAKAARVAKAALRDTRNPIPRISYSLTGSAKTASGSSLFHGGQLQYITSTAQGLNGSGTDAGPWAGPTALQPLRIARVTTTLLSGDGEKRLDIEVGGRRRHTWGGVPG